MREDRINGVVAAMAAMAPLYLFSTDMYSALALGWTFVLVHGAASAMTLLAPPTLGRGPIFTLSAFASAIACSLSASFIRMLDPFLFEAMLGKLFIVAFTVPVLKAAVLPGTIAGRERAWDEVVRGLALAGTLVAFGAARELLTSGGIGLGAQRIGVGPLPFASQPAGGLVILALAMAGLGLLGARPVRRDK